MQLFSSTIAGHIRSLLQGLNDSHSDSVLQELLQLTECGLQGSILVLQSCLDHINYGADVKNVQVLLIVRSIFRFFLDEPNFTTLFCQSLRNVTIREGFLDDLSNALHLSLSEKFAVGLALSESDNPDARLSGTNFCATQVERLFANPSAIGSTEQIHRIFMFLHHSEALSKHVDMFSEMLSLGQLKESIPIVMTSLLPDVLNDTKFLRTMNFFCDPDENDFDAIVARMEISVADVMMELGYGCTSDTSKCKEVLSIFLPFTEVTLARILGTVVRTHTGLEDNTTTLSSFLLAIAGKPISDLQLLCSWDASVLVNSIQQLSPKTNWIGVMENLDHEGFYIPSKDAFTLLMTMYKLACQDSFPLHAICGSVWKNSEGQLSFLKYAVSAPPELFTFSHSVRLLPYADFLHGLIFQPGQSNYAWLCLDLLDVICQLAERGHAATIRSVLEYPLKHCPEVLLLGIAEIQTPYNLLQREVLSTVLPMIISDASRKKVFLQLWNANYYLVLCGFMDVLVSDSDGIDKILDICQETKILDNVLDKIPFSFAIRLAAVASQKELLDLEKWLSDSLVTHKGSFFEESLGFLKDIQRLTSSEDNANRLSQTGAVSGLHSWTASVIVKVLQANAWRTDSKTVSDEIEKLHISSMHGNSYQQRDEVHGSSSLDTHSLDVKAEANYYFQCMFTEQLTVDVMVQMLAHFKESSEKREQSIFKCMISILLEEYKFFPNYPERQLGLAAVLYGSLIKCQLVTHLTLGITLRCVLGALRKVADSKMFAFGTKALEQFVSRLYEWPQYCNHILQISHMHSSHPELVACIKEVLAQRSDSENDPVDQLNISSTIVDESIGTTSLQQGQLLSSSIYLHPSQQVLAADVNKASMKTSISMKHFIATSVQSSSTSLADAVSLPEMQRALGAPRIALTKEINSERFGFAMNIQTLVAAAGRRETPVEAPTSEIQEKISFIINNISAATIEAKAKEFSEILNEQYYPWFAEYMVIKRVSIEPNFHELYLKFLDKVNSKALNKKIVQATYENCKVLLSSELIKLSSEERFLLKNLGSWLGKLTIGRNQCLRGCEICPKSLIIEAYEKGLMIAVIPFVTKILESCQTSVAYRPPNPWTMGILGLLAEIYAMANLKMNLKFDIQVTCRRLGIQINDATRTSLLRDHVRAVEGNLDFSNTDIGALPATDAEDKLGVMSELNQVELPLEVVVPSCLAAHPHQISSISSSGPSLGAHVVVNPNLSIGGQQTYFASVLVDVMNRAIREIVPTMLQPSVSIATQTTLKFVIEDYALELDEHRIFSAAHLMVANLAGNLAHVSCKEPLRFSMSSWLRSMLQGSGFSNEIMEQVVQLLTEDNLELGCAIIAQAAADKALQTIDNEISHLLSLRRRHGETLGSSIYEASLYAQGPLGLPETFHRMPQFLSLPQQRVYEYFLSLSWHNQQFNQVTNSALSGHFPCSAGGDLPQRFSALNSNAYLSGVGDTGFSKGGPLVNLAYEEIKRSPPQILSCVASNHIRFLDGVLQQCPKESGISSQPSYLCSASIGTGLSESLLALGDALDKYDRVALKLKTALANDGWEIEIQPFVSEILQIILRGSNQHAAAFAVAQKVFKALYESGDNSLHVRTHLSILAAICDLCKPVVKELTRWLIYCDEHWKFNKDVTLGLIQKRLLQLAEYDIHMAKLLDAGRNKTATEFAVSLLQTLVKIEPKVISELQNLIEALSQLAPVPGVPELLQQLAETIRNLAANTASLPCAACERDDENRLAREEKVFLLFTEWDRICKIPGGNNDLCAKFVSQLYQNGLLRGDDLSDHFFHYLLNLSVSHWKVKQASQSVQSSFLAIDVYSKLVFSILKYSIVEQESSKLFLLSKVLAVTVRTIQDDHDESKDNFNSSPYLRLFVNWLSDICSLEATRDDMNLQVLSAFANAFHILQPQKAPGFSFVWLELITHKLFMPKLLMANNQMGWPFVHRLLLDLFQFLEPYLRNAELTDPIRFLYQGTLRMLLVLLHDVPDFLCDYHFSFCDVIPPKCMHMRNIILSASPCNIRVPDPFTANVKIDILQETSKAPRIRSEVDAALKANQMKDNIDDYLKTRRQRSPFLSKLKQRLLLTPSEASHPGTCYNVPLINSLVLYVGMQASQLLQPQNISLSQPVITNLSVNEAALDIFKTLAMGLDSEGRYVFLNAIADQLRYPNSHTGYFSYILCCLFSDAHQVIVKEQITRVLVERLTVEKPHPWGLLVTLSELMKNPKYNFWNNSFTRCVPEIQDLLESAWRK